MSKNQQEINDHIIDKFKNEYSFLNNFYQSSIWINGKQYKTCEHAYQAHKTLDINVHELIRNSPDPMTAKKLGQAVQVRQDWNDVKVGLMKEFIKKKFEFPFLAELLIKTGDSKLIYGNTWNDKFWGVCRGEGENWLGKILEEVRQELKSKIVLESNLLET